MLGRRKRQDGFEWHKYIRTTIKLRREQRRERMLDARRAAGQQMQAAGVALAAGSRAAGAAARDGARAGAGAAGLAAQGALSLGAVAARHAGRRLADLLRPILDALARPNIGGPIALAGAIALSAGIGRYRGTGLDREAMITIGIGAVLLIASLPMLSKLTGVSMPKIAIPGVSARTGVMLVALAAIAAGSAWWWTTGRTTGLAGLASITSRLPLIGAAKPIEGRAQALGGDLLRVGNTTLRLAGVEAPEDRQQCGSGNRRFRCGASAQAALARLVNGRTVSCTPSGSDAAGLALASCSRGKLDINAELVRGGHVFAASGLFASYSGLERDARAAKAGIWAGGEAERPAEFRAKVWDDAKRRAPDGCPIKGLVTGRERVYVLPWAPDYERGRIQKARGERWFCSEQEARAAGWKPAARG